MGGNVLMTQRSEAQTTAKETIRLATSPGPYSDLFLKGVKPILEKEGYKVTSQSFSDLNHADEALDQGDADLNVEQHTAWLDNFNKQKKAHFVGIAYVPTVPMGIFPGSSKSIKNIKKGANIAIPNDPANRSRAYQLLQQAKLITLKKSAKNSVTVSQTDIAKNPHHLKFTEMNSSQIPRSIKDVNYAVLPGSISYSAKISAKTSLRQEKLAKQYLLVATVNKKNQNKPWAKAVVKAYASKQFKTYVKQHNQQGYWYIPKTEIN
ncbi:metal ABC transporter substrate-binding protein [Loigolactobacillus backii]|uniref:Metal ABC transporter substrate-binding protein n=2 Tax=Lactobacillaceae TaxID=33958 RepID=A0A192H5N4_9LACO|nr:metal ABC transporter substrate-binding protein [Loigolactobacillus backii]ANK63522.1 metal ABC transporter substrate-binding protein [Loigolactobacillus backii]ANK65927.1 metal ABC transporter substrate-binding protein [Loigolactobacillus backii]ANK68397.1 metal ABC transporter substrate-binding protein [Loigolactobacillus backii]ANK70858.1 metal ABC transporter substrate-binding protein [Loigolactobacillus backii]